MKSTHTRNGNPLIKIRTEQYISYNNIYWTIHDLITNDDVMTYKNCKDRLRHMMGLSGENWGGGYSLETYSGMSEEQLDELIKSYIEKWFPDFIE